MESEQDGHLIQEILGILHKWGIHTLGQFAALDKEDLGARLGPEAVRLWERANGQSKRLLKFVQLPETFDESFEFEHEIETAEPLLFMLRRFLEQLALRLGAIYLVAQELTLRITFSNSHQDEPTNASAMPVRLGPRTYERVFKIPQPTSDVDLLFRMLQTHLENFKSKHPIVAVALNAQPIRPASQQFGLFETALRNPNQLYETLARLTALVGTDRVGRPVLEETHRPDAFRMEPFAWSLGGTASVPPVRLGPSHYSSDATERIPPIFKPALRRFRPAAAASIFTSKDRPASRPKDSHFAEVAGSPSFFYLGDYEQRLISFEGAARQRRVWRHLQSGNIAGKVVDQLGPFLFSGNWWDEKSWARAEWDMQIDDGVVLRCHETEGTWKVDGIYD